VIRKKVNSGSIVELAWDKTVLDVTFASGACYAFEGVSKVVFEEFAKAKSKPGYFFARISGRYPYKTKEQKRAPAQKEERTKAAAYKD